MSLLSESSYFFCFFICHLFLQLIVIKNLVDAKHYWKHTDQTNITFLQVAQCKGKRQGNKILKYALLNSMKAANRDRARRKEFENSFQECKLAQHRAFSKN